METLNNAINNDSADRILRQLQQFRVIRDHLTQNA